MNQGLEKNIKKAVAAIRKAKKIAVIAHKNPDGDTIGCLLALGLVFLGMGKKVNLLCQDAVPTRYQFLPGSELVLSRVHEKPDLAISVDCGSISQLGLMANIFCSAPNTIQIDHHDFGEAYGKIQVVEPEAAAVGEVAYEIIEALGIKISQSIALCLLTSIVVDTGSFRFSNIRAKTFDICSKLVKTGVDLQALIEDAYWRRSREVAKLTGYCLQNTSFSKGGEIAWAVLNQKNFKQFSAGLSDADEVADELRSIEGVKISALFRETPTKKFRVSLRSNYGINVANVAKRFGGGGHHNSAGCSIASTDRELKKLLGELEKLVH